MSAQNPYPRIDDLPPLPVPGPGRSSYRMSAAPLELVEPPKRHKGPRVKCPLCGNAKKLMRTEPDLVVVDQITACSGSSWLVRLFGGCGITTLHLHQHCKTCGANWICDPIEEP